MARQKAVVHELRLEALRLENNARCAVQLRDSGPATVAELSLSTGLSRPTVKDRLNDLIERKLVVEIAKTEPVGQRSGRPAGRYAFDSDDYVLGIEVGKHGDRILACLLSGEIVGRHQYECSDQWDARLRLRGMKRHVDELMASLPGTCVGIGVAVPGTLTPDGVMLRSTPFKEWAGVDLRSEFRRYFDGPLSIENDLNAAALAEYRMGAASQASTFILALAWHQVAAGIFINKRLHRGVHHQAGELNQWVETGEPSLDDLSSPRLLAILADAEAGDSNALRHVEEFSAQLARQLAVMVLTIDPELVLLYGAAANNQFLIELVKRHLTDNIDPWVDVALRPAALGDDGPVLGVILMALDAASTRLLGTEMQGRVHFAPSSSGAEPPLTSSAASYADSWTRSSWRSIPSKRATSA